MLLYIDYSSLSLSLSLSFTLSLSISCNTHSCCLTIDWMSFAGDFCVRKYVQCLEQDQHSHVCILPGLDLIFLLFCRSAFVWHFYTLMMHTGLILVSRWGRFLQLVNPAVVAPPPPSQVMRIGWRWPHKWMCNAASGARCGPHKSSIYYSVGVHVVRDVIRELITFLLWENECVIMKSSAMNHWDRGKAPFSWVLGAPLIGDHVFVPDRLWNGVLLHGCVTPASHQGDWLVWSCGMFPAGPQ